MALLIMVKKDLLLMFKGKFFLASCITLLLFSLYIHFVPDTSDQEQLTLAAYDPRGLSETSIFRTESREALELLIASGSFTIGLDLSCTPACVLISDSRPEAQTLYTAYALATVETPNIGREADHEILIKGNTSTEIHSRRNMTSDLLFFEILTIGFIGIAALLFKEKAMGMIRLHSILPVSNYLYIFSKCVVFCLSDLIFSAILILVNTSFDGFKTIFPAAAPHITILSVAMCLLGLTFSLLYRDFRQFAVSFAFFVLILAVPVYLAASQIVQWSWLEFYPLYPVYRSLKNAFLGSGTFSLNYYIYSFLGCIILLFLSVCTFNKTITGGDSV